jgi:hypothetical protein
MRIARQDSLFKLFLWRDVREVSHICACPDRTHHLHNVWGLCAGSVLLCSGPIRLLGLLGALSLSEQRHSDAEKAKHRSS